MRRRRFRLINDLLTLTESQMGLLDQQLAEIQRLQRDNIDVQLSYSRIGRDLIAQFLIALDQPESHDEIRDRLVASLRDFNDEVARLEEQTR